MSILTIVLMQWLFMPGMTLAFQLCHTCLLTWRKNLDRAGKCAVGGVYILNHHGSRKKLCRISLLGKIRQKAENQSWEILQTFQFWMLNKCGKVNALLFSTFSLPKQCSSKGDLNIADTRKNNQVQTVWCWDPFYADIFCAFKAGQICRRYRSK